MNFSFQLSVLEKISVEEFDGFFSANMPWLGLHGEALFDYIAKLINNGYVYTVREEGCLVGVIGFYANDVVDHRAFLSIIAVDNSCRSKGLGCDLLHKMIEICGENQMTEIMANVLKDNKEAIDFYLRRGFVICGPGIDDNHWCIKLRLEV